MERQKIVIFDIDGTLANCDHRRAYLEAEKPDWKSFNLEENVIQDTVYEDIRELFEMYRDKYHVAIVTGRMENQRAVTMQWLNKNNIVPDAFFMRANSDYRLDSDVKREILNKIREAGYDVHVAVDDRDQVVQMWREEGIRCLQVANGNF